MGEVAIAVQEERNIHDRYAVAILEEDTCCSMGHLPRKIFHTREQVLSILSNYASPFAIFLTSIF